MSLGELLFTLLRAHDVDRERGVNLWRALPERRRQEYEAAARGVVAEANQREAAAK